MTPARWIVVCLGPFLLLSTCSDDEKPNGPKGGAGDESIGGESGGDGEGGSSGTAGIGGGAGGASAGEAGAGGEPSGGSSGRGGAGRGGTSTGGRGGTGGDAGSAGGGAGGEGGVVCMTVDIPLTSPSFDANTSTWTPYDQESGTARPIIVPATSVTITADTPPNVAHFGGVNDCRAGMFQSISIPEGAQTLTLTGYAQVTTAETGSAPFDVLTIQLWEDAQTTTGLVGDFAVFSNEDAAMTGWGNFSGMIQVGTHAGRSVDLDLWAETDGSLVTTFHIDSLKLTALVCL
jgi:hypothetical protein